MARFCKEAHGQWPNFDGYPPKQIEDEDIGDFFSPHDIIACLRFESEEAKNLTIILPYQAVFSLAKASI
jgi:hypothetical protein